eukprot:1633899-Amphidinium_carterae.1
MIREHNRQLRKGVFQGCALSMTLFCMTLDEAVHATNQRLHQMGIDAHILAYAVDISGVVTPQESEQVSKTPTETLRCGLAAEFVVSLSRVEAPVVLRQRHEACQPSYGQCS